MRAHLLGLLFGLSLGNCSPAGAAPLHAIRIDGDFSDWHLVATHPDPASAPGVLHLGIPDTHDTDHSGALDIPAFVHHPDVDLLAFKFTHDRENLYAYFRAAGQIGRTLNASKKGRYYVIVTIDVDQRLDTGYSLHEGGYYPTSSGYDLNMEIEFYAGAFNTGHYLNHGARNGSELDDATRDQTNGIVRILPGTYDYYTQWVWFDDPFTGTHRLPPPDEQASLTFVADKGPVYQGNIRIALSPDGHEAEMVAPFRGFLRDPQGQPMMALGKTLTVSFSLEASGELAPGGAWASDTGDPIRGYFLGSFPLPHLQVRRLDQDSLVELSWDREAIGLQLEHAPSLIARDWHPVLGSTTTNRVFVPLDGPSAFFRLREL